MKSGVVMYMNLVLHLTFDQKLEEFWTIFFEVSMRKNALLMKRKKRFLVFQCVQIQKLVVVKREKKNKTNVKTFIEVTRKKIFF